VQLTPANESCWLSPPSTKTLTLKVGQLYIPDHRTVAIGSVLKSQALQNLLAFFGFLSWSIEDSTNLRYYSTDDEYCFRPSRQWCSLAQIINVELFTDESLRAISNFQFLRMFHASQLGHSSGRSQYRTSIYVARHLEHLVLRFHLVPNRLGVQFVLSSFFVF